ncbi:vWA domain-containing protein [Thermocrinis sp.]|uniref:vWA domain-containing protein n=1 Tax=Thermocrinis sp. TaxID=2024383 RepID=UPI002FDCC3CE
MKDRWKAIASILQKESSIEIIPSYEGWGTGYDPVYIPVLEMWARGELEDVPPIAKVPKGIVFNVREFLKKDDEYALSAVRHELTYLLNTDLFLWRLGQREFFKFGYPPTSFVVLYSILESIKADENIIQARPFAEKVLRSEWSERLKHVEDLYPHHRFAIAFIEEWLGLSALPKNLQKAFREYLKAQNKEAYLILVDEVFGKYISTIERSQALNQIDLLLEEARGRVRQDAHRGRIMTDVLKKLPQDLQNLILSYKDENSERIDPEDRERILDYLKSLPEWMREYLKQMSYLDMVERDVRFFSHFLPKTLETELEHKGFLLFILKPWSASSPVEGSSTSPRQRNLSERDKRYLKEYGLSEEEFKTFHHILKDVTVYVESFKRKFEKLLPKEEENWSGAYSSGRRIDFKKIQREVPIKRGIFYKRREVPENKKLAFKLLIDLSSSMKKENKAENALKALLLFSETLHTLGMPFSISAFNDRVYNLKSFEEDYKNTKTNILNALNLLGGGTNLEKVLIEGMDELELFCKKQNIKGVLIVFSDGEPTRGLKEESLRMLIRELKGKLPVVGIGVGKERNFVEEYFEKSGVRISEISKIPQAFSRIVENYLKRLISV